jgi:DNA polymerase elongation subunit (family B)
LRIRPKEDGQAKKEKETHAEPEAGEAVKPKTLYFDSETAPTIARVYGRYDLRVTPDQVIDNGYFLCFQAAWNDGPVFAESLRGKGVLKPKDDKELVKRMSALVSEADIIIGHNAINYDLAKLSARLAVHKLPHSNRRWWLIR